MFFSLVKRTDINPEKIPTGKSKLSDTAKLLHRRMLQIKPETVVLFMLHVLLHVFKYL